MQNREERDAGLPLVRSVAEHPVRLQILSLLGREPLALGALSAKLQLDERATDYHLVQLEIAGFAERKNEQKNDQLSQVAYLRHLPTWVARAAKENRWQRVLRRAVGALKDRLLGRTRSTVKRWN